MKRWIMALLGTGVLVSLVALVVAWPAAAQPGAMWGQTGSPGTAGTPITMQQARDRVTQYLSQVGLSNLTVGEVMQFSNQFYVEVVDPQQKTGAFEVLISLDGQTVHPEPGPTMMWNTEYSPIFGANGSALRHGMLGSGYEMMGAGSSKMSGGHGMMSGSTGMMGSGSGMGYQPSTSQQLALPLTADIAVTQAQAWLDQNRSGLKATDATAFPGYFTLHTERDGKIVGMLSIQTTSGAIWEHTWHGDFIAMEPAS